MTARSERMCQSLWTVYDSFEFEDGSKTISTLKLLQFLVDYVALKRRAVPITGADYTVRNRELHTTDGDIESSIALLQQEDYLRIDSGTGVGSREQYISFQSPVLQKNIAEADVKLIRSVASEFEAVSYSSLLEYLEKHEGISFETPQKLI